MDVYLASSFNLIPLVEDAYRKLTEAGHIIPVRWWDRIELKRKFAPLSADIFYAEPECQYAYLRDRSAIEACQAIILISGDSPYKFAGASYEMGLADAMGKLLYSVGEIENSAMYYAIRRFKSIENVIDDLKEVQ